MASKTASNIAGGQPPGVGVVAAAVIAVEERDAARQRVPRAVGERQRRTLHAERRERRVVRDAAEREDGAAGGHAGEIRGEIVVAGADLGRRRLVVRAAGISPRW